MVDNKWHEYVKLNIDFHAVEFKRSENCIKKKKKTNKVFAKTGSASIASLKQ